MTEQQIAVVVVQVHAVPLAVPVHFAVGTLSFAGPLPVTIGFEFIIPYVDEFIFIDIPLMEVRADARTAGDGAVCQYRSGADAGIALEDRIAYFRLVISEEPFASVAGVYLPVFPAVAYEIEQPGELLVTELQFRNFGSASDGKDGEQTPPFYTHLHEKFLE